MKVFFCAVFLLFSVSWSLEAFGRDYSLRIEGQKSMHFEKRLAMHAPIGFYAGSDRREQLRLAINGELYQRVKVEGEIENAGSGDEEGILWLSLKDRAAGLTLGRFNAAFSGSRLFCVDRRVEGGAVYFEQPWVRAEALVSRPNGTPCYEKLSFSGRGEYFVAQAPVVFQSERIELERDVLQRGRDYIFDYTIGRFYFTPRFLAEHALEENRSASLIRVVYEASSELGQGLNGGRVVFSPFSFLRLGGIGLAEQTAPQGDSATGISGQTATQYGYGALASLGRDSAAYVNGEIGFQDARGRQRVAAGSVEGRFSLRELLDIRGEYENFEPGYVLQGNSPVEPGLARARGALRFQPVAIISGSAEYAAGGYDNADGRVRENEAFARADLKPGKAPWLSAWGKQRQITSDSSYAGNLFLHGEVSKNLAWGGLAAGGEYETFSGILGAGNMERRVPVFLKAYSTGTAKFNYQLLAGGESVRYAPDNGAGAQEEVRGRTSAIVSGSVAGFNASATGAASAGPHGLLENSLEGSFDGSAGPFTTVSARVRDALQTSRQANAPDSQSAERRTFAAGEIRFAPFSTLSLGYAPVFRKRRNQEAGRDILSEVRHSGEASAGKGALKGALAADLLRRTINEQIRSHSQEEETRGSLQALLPFEAAMKASAEYRHAKEDEMSPFSGDVRSKSSVRKKGEAALTMPAGEKGLAELGLSLGSFTQTVFTLQAMDRDSSYLTTPYGMELSEAYVNIDRIERMLEPGYSHRGKAWEAGFRMALFYNTDYLSPEGTPVSDEETLGLQPLLNLQVNPAENVSFSSVVSGVFSRGYVHTDKGVAEAMISYTYKLLTASGRAMHTIESTRFYSSRISEFFLDLLLRI
ncbi:MAG: hypothetical protein A2268_02635 [Candidatus Raymondbacteria bacterium RifOxyA12_full_50_37]|uniref:Uncharacterized protein n=1 Tax=Candidatus Raymondbacteria bacterium RIFOXYD12_FULL_49_13 TaxID=1817890 RepID=A0A1F7F5P3_UNCRA|nr:MAG: hypothetical protein A2268_02635 [Candidatus Raymondbacteria bacterium RifOxyA12_full_50_37]OGJ89165.1 MAG: hypothetical protein A2248_11455 [Candidatus Raymondbacteria bacterium RIFOXYA2_FULL_49_16]OGJ96647.1 MAG: hypothetical protein A2453_06570 [Candidatus Raymondbacteria bacterium RIFOXYC2_FULL_50_21]OGK01959.1 MAG: hypothetical protein A2519_17675 [Candidatus Raymondbacteria bacterium RIFOXYD12_FULL_49_13]OGP42207.1 MAG: hypothetical protein A2324_02295 [Candidatus Raymondbacteria 